MKLILGVDDSPFSALAVEYVRGASWPAGTTITVICAVPPILVAIPGEYLSMADELEKLQLEQRAAGTQHVKAIEEELTASGVKVEGRVVDGDPREVLVEAARTTHADLLIVGSHGRTGLSKLFMGSVASHVVTHAPCSVLVVRRPFAN